MLRVATLYQREAYPSTSEKSIQSKRDPNFDSFIPIGCFIIIIMSHTSDSETLVKDDSIPSAINELLETEFTQAPREINNGSCGDFAEAVCDNISTALMVDVLDVIPAKSWRKAYEKAGSVVKVFGAHTWVTGYYGRHYDAEAPEGVDNFWELPIYQRSVNQSEYESGIEVLSEVSTATD